MSDHKIRPLEDLTRLLCKQVTDWDKALLSVRGQRKEDAKSAFSNAYIPLHEPLTKEVLSQLSTDTKINNIEAHKAILSLVLPHKSAKTVAERTKDGTIPVATIEGFRSIMSYLASTLLSWSDCFEQCQKIEDDEEFKYFMVMRIPVIQGSQNQWDFRDIGKQPFDKSECVRAIDYLKSSALTHVECEEANSHTHHHHR